MNPVVKLVLENQPFVTDDWKWFIVFFHITTAMPVTTLDVQGIRKLELLDNAVLTNNQLHRNLVLLAARCQRAS